MVEVPGSDTAKLALERMAQLEGGQKRTPATSELNLTFGQSEQHLREFRGTAPVEGEATPAELYLAGLKDVASSASGLASIYGRANLGEVAPKLPSASALIQSDGHTTTPLDPFGEIEIHKELAARPQALTGMTVTELGGPYKGPKLEGRASDTLVEPVVQIGANAVAPLRVKGAVVGEDVVPKPPASADAIFDHTGDDFKMPQGGSWVKSTGGTPSEKTARRAAGPVSTDVWNPDRLNGAGEPPVVEREQFDRTPPSALAASSRTPTQVKAKGPNGDLYQAGIEAVPLADDGTRAGEGWKKEVTRGGKGGGRSVV